jgi:drug/metabolite transporter (DMT)-like permease
VQELTRADAAILGFTMPIFTVLLGAAFFGERASRPGWVWRCWCAALAIGLLLWHELARLVAKPWGCVVERGGVLGTGHADISPSKLTLSRRWWSPFGCCCWAVW